jgi:hypothetical protein
MNSPSSSFVGWIDYSEKERASMMNALSLFSQGTLDELGIGTIRDALSDVLFPGTSTIQTRVRYFLIVAWIYQRVESRVKRGHSVSDYARYVEAKVTESLRRSPGAKGRGVIGADVGALLLRPASDIYWRGVRKWGIRLRDGSRDQYHRWIDLQRQTQPLPSEVQAEDEESQAAIMGTWHASLPKPPTEFPEMGSLELEKTEALYLRERILTVAPNSYLAFLVRESLSIADFELPWSGADAWSMSPDLKRQLDVARRFSETIYGALLTYNLMLARANKSERWILQYEGDLDEWGVRIEAAAPRYIDWDLNELWAVVEGISGRTNPLTKDFVEAWQGFIVDSLRKGVSASRLVDRSEVQALIQRREQSLKRGRARLSNPERLASWSGNSGVYELDYRWPVVKSHVMDIQVGSFKSA